MTLEGRNCHCFKEKRTGLADSLHIPSSTLSWRNGTDNRPEDFNNRTETSPCNGATFSDLGLRPLKRLIYFSNLRWWIEQMRVKRRFRCSGCDILPKRNTKTDDFLIESDNVRSFKTRPKKSYGFIDRKHFKTHRVTCQSPCFYQRDIGASNAVSSIYILNVVIA